MGFDPGANLLLEGGDSLLLENGSELALQPTEYDINADVGWEIAAPAILDEPSVVRINDGPGGNPGWGVEVTAAVANPFSRQLAVVVGWAVEGEAELNIVKEIDLTAEVGWGVQAPTHLVIPKDIALGAEVGWGWGAAAELDVVFIPGLTVDVGWQWAAPTRINLAFGGTPPVRVESNDSRLLGVTGYAHGPFETAIVTSREARQICMLNLRDPVRIPVIGAWHVGGRPLAIGSRGFKRDDPLVFVLVERTEEPGASAELQAWGLVDGRMAKRGTVRLPGIQVWALTAPDGAGTANLWNREKVDFLVVATLTGEVQLRSADDEMALLATMETGCYQPRVAGIIARQDKDRSEPPLETRVWDIPLFSERTARGVLLRYSRTQSVVATVGGMVPYSKQTLSFVDDITAAQVEGPESLRRAVDSIYGFFDIDQDAYQNGIFTSADDENAGFDREWNLEAQSVVLLSPGPTIPSGGPLSPFFIQNRVVTLPISQFTGYLSATFRDNRSNAYRYGRFDVEFVRADGSVIAQVECWMGYRVGTEPTAPRQAWVSDARYAEVKFEAQANNVTFPDGGNAFYVVRAPESTQFVRITNWSYAYPRNQADFNNGRIETTFPYTFPIQTRPRITVRMHDRELDLVVRRYDQIQRFNTVGEVPRYASRRTFRAEKLLGADWLHDETATIASLEQQGFDTTTADGPVYPRNAVFRVPGGYVHLHASTGRVVKHYIYPEEILGPQP